MNGIKNQNIKGLQFYGKLQDAIKLSDELKEQIKAKAKEIKEAVSKEYKLNEDKIIKLAIVGYIPDNSDYITLEILLV